MQACRLRWEAAGPGAHAGLVVRNERKARGRQDRLVSGIEVIHILALFKVRGDEVGHPRLVGETAGDIAVQYLVVDDRGRRNIREDERHQHRDADRKRCSSARRGVGAIPIPRHAGRPGPTRRLAEPVSLVSPDGLFQVRWRGCEWTDRDGSMWIRNKLRAWWAVKELIGDGEDWRRVDQIQPVGDRPDR